MFNLLTVNTGWSQTKQQSEYTIKCTMSVNEIMQEQEIIKDSHEYAKANTITEVLLTHINLFYQELNNNGVCEATDIHKDAIESAIKSAKIIGMNYTMFLEDINFIRNTERFSEKLEGIKPSNH